jgi:HSP20 family protein
MDIPGANRSELDVELADHRLTVRGDRGEADEAEDAGRTLQSERAGGSFSRMVMLPGGVNSAGVWAGYENGVLTVRIPKGDEDTTRIDIPVN